MRVKLGVIFLGVFVLIQVLSLGISLENKGVLVYKQTAATKYNLTDYASRQIASIEKPVSSYKTKKCGNIKHTDGTSMAFCLATFDDSTAGFYDPSKELMVVNSFSQYTLIHEITHATTLHFYKKGMDMTLGDTQEKMAYNSENLLMQIVAFKEDFNLTPDMKDTEKVKYGIPVQTKVGKELAKK